MVLVAAGLDPIGTSRFPALAFGAFLEMRLAFSSGLVTMAQTPDTEPRDAIGQNISVPSSVPLASRRLSVFTCAARLPAAHSRSGDSVLKSQRANSHGFKPCPQCCIQVWCEVERMEASDGIEAGTLLEPVPFHGVSTSNVPEFSARIGTASILQKIWKVFTTRIILHGLHMIDRE